MGVEQGAVLKGWEAVSMEEGYWTAGIKSKHLKQGRTLKR